MRKRKRRKKRKLNTNRIKLILISAVLLLFLIIRIIRFIMERPQILIYAPLISVTLLVLIRIFRKYLIGLRINNITIAEIDAMKGIQFEEYLKDLFIWKGYEVEKTKNSGDYGGDLVLLKDGKTIVVQAKRYHKPVGLKAVQEVVASLNVYEAKEGWVVTNNYFTKNAILLAKVNQVKLIDRDKLIRIINQRERSKKIIRVIELLKGSS